MRRLLLFLILFQSFSTFLLRVRKDIEELTGYKIERAPNFVSLDREKFQKLVKNKLVHDPNVWAFKYFEEFLRYIHFLNSKDSLLNTYIKLYEVSAGGFYDPETKKFFIMKGFPRSMLLPILVHEYYHFYQDLRYDVLKLLSPKGFFPLDDKLTALKSIIEGEATVFSERYYREFINSMIGISFYEFLKNYKVKAPALYYAMAENIFLYEYGRRYILEYLKTHRWKDISELYSKFEGGTKDIFELNFKTKRISCGFNKKRPRENKICFSFGYVRWLIVLSYMKDVKKAQNILDSYICDNICIANDMRSINIFVKFKENKDREDLYEAIGYRGYK